jgi:hypothetical protein
VRKIKLIDQYWRIISLFYFSKCRFILVGVPQIPKPHCISAYSFLELPMNWEVAFLVRISGDAENHRIEYVSSTRIVLRIDNKQNTHE